jgi:hypothetical protein
MKYDPGMPDKLPAFEIHCPCCGAMMVVDPATHAILRHEVPRKPAASFEEMLKDIDAGKKRRESQMARAMEEHQNRDEILDKKFKEALKKAESDTAPLPKKPIDLD